MTGVPKKTVMRLLAEAGEVATRFQHRMFHGLTCRRLQLDELWGFCHCKEEALTEEIAAKNPGAGDVRLWLAIDAYTKVVPCWALGDRDANTEAWFIDDLASRLRHRVQITTDAHRAYLDAIEGTFGYDVDYAPLVKHYGASQEKARYSPAECIGCEGKIVSGSADPNYISTSYAERQNWIARTSMRGYARLSDGVSRKLENRAAAVAPYYFAYNFTRIHRALGTTSAMAARVASRFFEVSGLVALLKKRRSRR